MTKLNGIWFYPLVVSINLLMAATSRSDNEFRALFDGKTLNGWEGNLEYFRVAEESIIAGSLENKIPHNEFLATKQKFSDFELRLEVKLVGEGNNAGVQFRSKRVPDSTEVEGYQCDAGAAWDRPVWGALYDESRRRKMLAEGPKESLKQWVKEGEWNSLRVLATGNRIRLFLNGHQTVDYTEKDEGIPGEGIIAMQIHSGPPTEAWYRNIEIREIGKIELLRRKRVEILENAVEQIEAVVNQGMQTPINLQKTRLMLLDAKIELARKDDARQELLEEKIRVQEDLVEMERALNETSGSNWLTLWTAESDLLKLKIELEEFKARL